MKSYIKAYKIMVQKSVVQERFPNVIQENSSNDPSVSAKQPTNRHPASDYQSSDAEPTSVSDFFEYLHWRNCSACKIPMYFGGVVHKNTKFIGMDGQKAICLDPGIAPDPKSCLVYSFGINNEWSFDDSIAEYGCHVFAFDPSMSKGDHQRSEKIQFFNTGLGTKNEKRNWNGWEVRTLSALKTKLGHNDRVIDILKIDIENAEWTVLMQMVQEGALEQVKQLAVEIHVGSERSFQSFIQDYWKVLIGIERSGFTRFSSDVNPFMKETIKETGQTYYVGYEIAWFNQKFKSS